MVAAPEQAKAAEAQGTAWDAIKRCESGNQNIRTRVDRNRDGVPDSTASGWFQITDPTWKLNGGLEFARRAMDATYEQQHNVANRIYTRAGNSFRDWNASRKCWGGDVSTAPAARGSAPAPVRVAAAAPQASTPPRGNVLEDRNGDGIHTAIVKRGDTMRRIAADHGVAFEVVRDFNRAAIPNANRIFVGQRIGIPIPGAQQRAPERTEQAPADRTTAAGYHHPLPGGTTGAHGAFGAPRSHGSHKGMDFGAPTGSQIRSVHGGVVHFVGTASNCGLTVIVKGDDGWFTTYCHNSSNIARQGQRVNPGSVIALVGHSGNASASYPHVHFEVSRTPWRNQVNPRGWLQERGVL